MIVMRKKKASIGLTSVKNVRVKWCGYERENEEDNVDDDDNLDDDDDYDHDLNHDHNHDLNRDHDDEHDHSHNTDHDDDHDDDETMMKDRSNTQKTTLQSRRWDRRRPGRENKQFTDRTQLIKDDKVRVVDSTLKVIAKDICWTIDAQHDQWTRYEEWNHPGGGDFHSNDRARAIPTLQNSDKNQRILKCRRKVARQCLNFSLKYRKSRYYHLN